MLRLITFRPSHYCEKARWALDRAGISYREESHVPIVSWAATFTAGGRRTVPVLVADGEVLPDSTDILQWIDSRSTNSKLFPPDLPEAAELEEEFDRRLGPAARRLAYFHLLNDRELVMQVLRKSTTGWESRAVPLLHPVIRAAIVFGLKIDAAGAERSQRALTECFSKVSARLADGRRYLCGDRFTAADLTFAALAYPILWPSYASALLAPLESLPESLQSLIQEQRGTVAGQFGLRLWAQERVS